MNRKYLAVAMAGTFVLGACETYDDEPMMPPPPVGVGAIAGTVAADRDGDGVVDGYYGADGVYRAFVIPPPPPCPTMPPPSTSGERG
ncbi:hypothetical protein ACFQRC_05515 [Enterovirga sp. GCM10030262]|uniref:hypothetical protein n=1 Tax=Enterovirga sp. GCM10030262 TaxID=3273391 RepID=UPI003619A576